MPQFNDKAIYQYCHQVIDFINKDLGIIPTNRLPQNPIHEDTKIYLSFKSNLKDYLFYLKRIESIMSKKRRFVEKELDLHPEYDSKQVIELIAAATQKTKVGNCEGMSCLAYIFLEKLIPYSRLELLTCDNHMFIVINRLSKSSLDNSNTWGEKCIILDAWARRAYPSSQFNTEKKLYYPAAPRDINNPNKSYLSGRLTIFHAGVEKNMVAPKFRQLCKGL